MCHLVAVLQLLNYQLRREAPLACFVFVLLVMFLSVYSFHLRCQHLTCLFCTAAKERQEHESEISQETSASQSSLTHEKCYFISNCKVDGVHFNSGTVYVGYILFKKLWIFSELKTKQCQ